MTILKCKMCGDNLEVEANQTYGTCPSCGSTMTLPNIDDDQKAALYNRANHFRLINDFDKALSLYENILTQDDTEAEAHWGSTLCRFGIEYVEESSTKRRVPTCHRLSFNSILQDEDYLQALNYTKDSYTKELYIKEAEYIAKVQKEILEISQKEEAYDIFICYKEKDEQGNRTQDSVLAQEIYLHLTDAGYRVFFSRITLESKLGHQFEPYIFAALYSSKIMIVVGTTGKYVIAPWVQNEWRRYLAMMEKDKRKILIPCYRDMLPYDFPNELSILQCQDLGKLGYLQDLLHGINKLMDSCSSSNVDQSGKTSTGNQEDSLLKRGWLFLGDKDFLNAETYFQRVLDSNPHHVLAYVGLLCVECETTSIIELESCNKDITALNAFHNAIRFATKKEEQWLSELAKTNRNSRLEQERIARFKNYKTLVEQLPKKPIEHQIISYRRLIKELNELGNYEDAPALVIQCKNYLEKAVIAQKQIKKRNGIISIVGLFAGVGIASFVGFLYLRKDEKPYQEAYNLMNEGEYQKAADRFEDIIAYKDSEELAKKSLYSYGVELMEANQFLEAIAIFETMVEYEDSREWISACYYGNGILKMEEGAFIEAAESFRLCETYSDATELLEEAEFLQAQMFVNAGDMVSVQAILEGMQDEKIEEMHGFIYSTAQNKIAEGKQYEALPLLSTIPNYQGAKNQWMQILATTVTGGEYQFLGIEEDGTARFSGWNHHGQGNIEQWSDLVSVAAGAEHTVGLRLDGTAVGLGTNYDNRCNITGWTDIIQLDTGAEHTVALFSDGTVKTIGGSMMVQDTSHWTDIIQISAGGDITVGLRRDGTVITSDWQNREEIDTWKDIIQVHTGGGHTLGLDQYGVVHSAGNNHFGEQDFDQFEGVVKVLAGEVHTIFLFENGTALGFGKNDDGECEVRSWVDLVDVNVSEYHTIGLKADGSTYFAGSPDFYGYELISDQEWYEVYDVASWGDIKVPMTPLNAQVSE